MKFHYNGSDERVLPTLGLIVQPNTEFDAPEGFTAPDVTNASGKAATKKASEPTPSAAPDTTEGE